MRMPLKSLLTAMLLTAFAMVVAAQEGDTTQPAAEDIQPPAEDTTPVAEDAADEPLPEEYSCMFCHGEDGTLAEDEDMKHLIVTEEHLGNDIHWQKGLRCHDCHGGSPLLEEFEDHRDDDSFRSLASPGEIPEFCGHCHSSVEYMRRYNPSARTDQVSEYWTSGHGMQLKDNPGDTDVAICTSCHGHHEIRAVNDMQSPIYATNLAKTCAVCHADEKRMAGREYHGKALGTQQYADWSDGVHAKALLKDGDISAPTCNDCHGNHGALPPDVDSVANACGTCHVKIASLFAETSMKHRFEESGLPGCATCHSNHKIEVPSDDMLGMQAGAVCAKCHSEGEEKGKYGATLAGRDAAKQMSEGLQQLKGQIDIAENKLDEAETLGMLVMEPRFKLLEARDALTNARSLIHSFSIDPVREAIDAGLEVAAAVESQANEALNDYTMRRIWLALTLVPILIMVGLLLLYIKSLPIPR